MIDKQDILERLKAFCVGHPHAKIPWPHRELHEAAAEITRLRAELAAARDKALEEAALEWLKPPISGTRNFAEILRAMKGTPNAEGQ